MLHVKSYTIHENMAILDKVFKDKKEKSEKEPEAIESTPKTNSTSEKSITSFGVSQGILIRPYITEKASIISEANAYTFEVNTSANKSEIAKAIKELYKVTPKKINIVYRPAKKVVSKGKVGVKSRKKKAIIYLKKGDKIEFV
ncbi:MAG TPA: 50S ribosomal protein L23 [Candidatus Yonathbacteria bacterium]|nr:50S ribosomal protein L23 [Candidatus Yonathbacteria bacterium]